jgi:hypothetical protein
MDYQELIEPALERLHREPPSAEVQHLVEELLHRIRTAPPSPRTSRELRAIEFLRKSRAPEARTLLEELARGAPEALLTNEAQRALAQLP